MTSRDTRPEEGHAARLPQSPLAAGERSPAPPSTFSAIDVRRLQYEAEAERELAELTRSDADLLLLSDYTARALAPEEMQRVEERLARDADFRALGATLLMARDAMHDAVTRTMDEAMGEAEGAWGRLRLRETADVLRGRASAGGSSGPTPRPWARWLLRGTMAVAVVAVVMVVGRVGWGYYAATHPTNELWEIHRAPDGMNQFHVQVSSLTSVRGIGRSFVAVRRDARLSALSGDVPTREVYGDASMLALSVDASDGHELQLETPLMTVRARDANATITEQQGGYRRIYVQRGRVMVTLHGTSSAPIAIGEGYELSVTPDGEVDRSPPRGSTGYRRVPLDGGTR